jgi:hypothetical protein
LPGMCKLTRTSDTYNRGGLVAITRTIPDALFSTATYVP